MNVFLNLFADAHVVVKVVRGCFAGFVGKTSDRICNVADHFQLWKVNIIYHSRSEVDVDYPGCPLVVGHKKWRFFHHIVSDVYDQISAFNGAVEIVAIG